jgi:acyl transferase domain-containing protein
MSCRLSCVARSQEELVRVLEQWTETGAASQVYTAELPESRIRENVSLKKFGNYCIQECRNATDAAGYLENLAAIAELYVQGYSLDYRSLFSPDSRRIPLPTYPFAKEHYWIDTTGPAKTQAKATATASAPLLQASVPNLNENVAATEAVPEPLWLFSTDLPVINGNGTQSVLMAAEEKIELFLKQETALALRKPMEEIATNMSHFDLGLSSLAVAGLVHKVNRLLNENLNPSTLFEYRDIQSLAAYLAATYPSKIDALTVTRRRNVHSPNPEPLPAIKDVPVSPEPLFREQTETTASGPGSNSMRISEEVWWQDVALNNGYEKVTF